MRLCFLGGYDSQYPRNAIIRKGLKGNGVGVSECGISPKYKFWLRYPLVLLRSGRSVVEDDFLFVPEFCQKDVPLARVLSFLGAKKVIFDPLASRFETKILDWKRKPVHSWQAWWNFKIDSWAFRLSDLVLADTHIHKDYYCLKYGLSAEKVEVLPVGFDDDIFKPGIKQEWQDKENRFMILFFGSFLPLHGVETIVRAAEIISKEDRFIGFHLVGSGQTWPRTQALASELNLDNLSFENWLPQEILPSRIAASDICLGIFGRSEKTERVVPHKIFQAMAMGKPVITLRTPAVEELFSNREHLFLCPTNEPSALAQAILELKENSVLREEIAEKGYTLVSQHFSPQAIGRRLIDILERKFGPLPRRTET